jgi:hypothetical protein
VNDAKTKEPLGEQPAEVITEPVIKIHLAIKLLGT